MSFDNEKSINEKQGVIFKCPSCGGDLKAFSSKCELCGHELAGVAANRSVAELVARFDQIERELTQSGMQGSKLEREITSRKARVIRDFPIPNSRGDLQSLLHYIAPKIQDNVKPDPNVEDWRVKFKEVMNLAKNAYKGDAKVRAEFEEIERSLSTTLSNAMQTRAKRSPMLFGVIGLVTILVVAGFVGTQYEKWNLKQCEDQYAKGASIEKARLEGVLSSIRSKIEQRLYTDATGLASTLQWDYKTTCKLDDSAQEQTRWEEKKKEMTTLIQRQESDEAAQQQAAAQRDLDAKRAAETLQIEERRATAERELAGKLAAQAKISGAARKASNSKDW